MRTFDVECSCTYISRDMMPWYRLLRDALLINVHKLDALAQVRMISGDLIKPLIRGYIPLESWRVCVHLE